MQSSPFMNSVVAREYRYLINKAIQDKDEKRKSALEAGLEEAWRKHRESLTADKRH